VALSRPASPFSTEPIEEIDLREAPLARVLTQVRFPSLTKLRGSEAITPFALSIETEYPFSNELKQTAILLTPGRVTTEETDQRVWVFRSADEKWTVTVTAAAISLETTAYTSRREFAERFRGIITAFQETMSPPYAERLGVRYTNRLVGENWLGEIRNLVYPEVLGGLAIPTESARNLRVSLTDVVFEADGRGIQMKHGVLPKDTILDPGFPPVGEVSWILDLDSFTQGRLMFDAERLTAELRDLAAQAYRMFRWSVNEEFVKRFGGET